LIRGGTVVDGTGAAPFAADVRVKSGLIAEVGPSLKADGEKIIDASGAYVTPGFVDNHTHLDGAMFWSPDLDPLPGFGTTTAVMGNCGVTMAPLSDAMRPEVIDLFCYLEDLPVGAFENEVPWGWGTSFGDYRRAAQASPTSINLEGYAGHISMRATVMGEAAWERAATAEETARMAAMLEESMRNGALGFSTNLMDNDRRHRPVPTRLAEDSEFDALYAAMAMHPGGVAQIESRFAEPQHHANDMTRMAGIAKPHGVRSIWLTMATSAFHPQQVKDGFVLHNSLRESGADFWPTFQHKPFALFLNFDHSLFFEWMPAWHDMMYSPKETRANLLSDPEWRARARDSMDHHKGPPGYPFERPDVVMLSYSETGAGPIGVSLGQYARERNQHPSDALADWLIPNGLGSILSVAGDQIDEDAVVRLIRDPHTVAAPNDTGAHLQLFEAAGQLIYLLTHYVRDAGKLSIQEAVHAITGKQTAFFGLSDRGVIAPGRTADINVFALDEIRLNPEEKAYDVPGGSWRFVRKPAGFRTTMVRGIPTFEHGKATGARPGRAFGGRSS
jgi:N-acyl-D-aspartate/D-glutamate deacylase